MAASERILFVKAMVHGHIKKDGTVVRQYERKDRNSRSAKFGRVFAAAIRAHNSLSDEAKRMLEGWNINWHTSDFAKWDNGSEKSSELRRQVKEAFRPVREVLRREFGDTVRLYRGQKEIGDDEIIDGRQLFSWSPDAGIASEYAHGRALPPEITDKQIAEQVESYRRSGIAKLGRHKFVRTEPPEGYEPDGPDYYYIYDGREMITDGEDIEDHFLSEQADRKEWIEELKSRGRVHAADIPVDDVVWIPVGANLAQPELITTHNPLRPMAKSVAQPVDLTTTPVRADEPTRAQAEAGNYAKRALPWRGLTIRIENEAGSVRRGTDPGGKAWETHMPHPYGYIVESMGVDGDPVDVYVGPFAETAEQVFVVHQRRVGDWEKFDEDKAFIGFLNADDARQAFLQCYDDPRFLGPITAMPAAEFVEKVRATKKAPRMIKARVGPYIRLGRLVNLAGYDGRQARAQAAAGQAALFSDDEAPAPEPKKADLARHDHTNVGDLFEQAQTAPVRQTDTPQFREWFGASKVTRDGEPLRMYHASYRDFDQFDRRKSVEWRRMETMDTVGSWFSDSPAKEGGAGMYASGDGAVIYPVYLSIQNPKYYASFDEFLNDMHIAAGRDPDKQNPKGRGTTEELRAKLKSEGYDGIRFGKTYNKQVWQRAEQLQQRVKEAKDAEWAAPKADRARFTARREKAEGELRQLRRRLDTASSTEFDDQEVWVAFDPHQIKSAIGNNGDFSKESPVITKAIQAAGRRRVLFMKTHVSGYVNSKGTFVAAHEDSRIKHPSEDKGWLGADMADAIRDHMESDPAATFGLRVIPRGFEARVGDELPPSKRWEDGEDTGEELRGTSTIGVTMKNVDHAIRTLERAGYSGDQIALVAGDSAGFGEDDGERLISEAKVVAVWRRGNKMTKSHPVLFLKAKHRGDDRTVDMFAAPAVTHLEVRTRKDGVVQGYNVAPKTPPKIDREKIDAVQAKRQLAEKRDMLNDFMEARPDSPNADGWRKQIAEIDAQIGPKKVEKKEGRKAPDMSGWSEHQKAAYALRREYEDGMMYGSAKEIGEFKRKIRRVAKTIPENDDKAVLQIDNLVTRVWGTNFDPKRADVEFAPPADAKDAALDAAISHLKEDAKQGDLPKHEQKEDAALVAKLEEARGGKRKPEMPTGRMSYARAVAENMEHMGTKESEWSAVEVTGVADTEDDAGERRSMPVFKFPEGYSNAPSLFKGEGCCNLCGTTIKNYYWIKHDGKKWTMPVGSECVTKFNDGVSGEKMAKKTVALENRGLLRDFINSRRELWSVFSKRVHLGYGRYETEIRIPEAHDLYRKMGEMRGKMDADGDYASNDASVTKWVAKNKEAAADLIKKATDLVARWKQRQAAELAEYKAGGDAPRVTSARQIT